MHSLDSVARWIHVVTPQRTFQNTESLQSRVSVHAGFFYISNHGISQQLIDRAFACSIQ